MKIDVTAPFCVFSQDYGNYKIYSYGRISTAFMPRIGQPQIFTVEIIEQHETVDGARLAAACFQGDRIMCHQSGLIWASVEDAARATGIHPGTLRNHLNGRVGYNAPKGLTFQKVPRELFL